MSKIENTFGFWDFILVFIFILSVFLVISYFRKNNRENFANICKDNNNQCRKKAALGECASNINYMLKNCRKSCLQCSSSLPDNSKCVDDHKLCAYWASKDQCNKNALYMKNFCKKSCNVCGPSEISNRSERSVSPSRSNDSYRSDSPSRRSYDGNNKFRKNDKIKRPSGRKNKSGKRNSPLKKK